MHYLPFSYIYTLKLETVHEVLGHFYSESQKTKLHLFAMTLLRAQDSKLWSRAGPGVAEVEEAKVIMAPHFAQLSSQILLGLHHFYSEVGTLSVTPDDG